MKDQYKAIADKWNNKACDGTWREIAAAKESK